MEIGVAHSKAVFVGREIDGLVQPIGEQSNPAGGGRARKEAATL